MLLIIEGYFELCISSWLALSPYQTNTIVQYILAWIGVALLIILPLLLIWVHFVKLDRLREPEFEARWGALYSNVKT